MTILDKIKEIAKEPGLNPLGLDGVDLYRLDEVYCATTSMSVEAICFAIQGRKTVYVGDQEINYDENTYLIGTANMPIKSELKDVTKDKPYYGLVIRIDTDLLAELLNEVEGMIDHAPVDKMELISNAPINSELSDSLMKLLNLADNPLKMKVLGKAALKEIYLNILLGEKGYLLKNCISNHAHSNRIMPTIHFLERNFKDNLSIETLVKISNMSSTTLHEKFKEATSLSPIQFLKRIRLHNAQTLILKGESAGDAAFDSGYNNQAQFSREYKRLFGYTPTQTALHV